MLNKAVAQGDDSNGIKIGHGAIQTVNRVSKQLARSSERCRRCRTTITIVAIHTSASNRRDYKSADCNFSNCKCVPVRHKYVAAKVPPYAVGTFKASRSCRQPITTRCPRAIPSKCEQSSGNQANHTNSCIICYEQIAIRISKYLRNSIKGGRGRRTAITATRDTPTRTGNCRDNVAIRSHFPDTKRRFIRNV